MVGLNLMRRGSAFPECFYGFTHNLVASFGTFSPSNDTLFHRRGKSWSADADTRIQTLYADFKSIAEISKFRIASTISIADSESPFPLIVDIPNFTGSCENIKFDEEATATAIIFTLLVTCSIRNCISPSSKLAALEMLLVFGIILSDQDKLDRVIPYIVNELKDRSSTVKIKALLVLTQVVFVDLCRYLP
jgi:phosphoinositide-3-kinase regulatory subunit 4